MDHESEQLTGFRAGPEGKYRVLVDKDGDGLSLSLSQSAVLERPQRGKLAW